MSFEDIAQREVEARRTAEEMHFVFHGKPMPTTEIEEEDEQERTSGESGGADSEGSEGGSRARCAR